MNRGRSGGGGVTYSTSPVASSLEARRFKMEELEQSTRHFDESNLIGYGTFGLVFKGFLSDGTIVAIKRRNGPPQREFSEEVAYLSRIRHRNLVTLIGYCQDRGSLMLVFEYLPNGSIRSHLHDSKTKLEFKQRLSISIGAAKGLSHLHGLQPPVVHGNFQTGNVLVDENFIAKVADTGVSKLIAKIDGSSSSPSSSHDVFRDPELGPHEAASHESNDVYSFGVFLLELVSGREVKDEVPIHILHQVRRSDLVGGSSFTEEGMRWVMGLIQKCTVFPGSERPRMENVAMELEEILESEITRTTVMGEGTTTVTLGSQLFTN
ncbi:hypothetical protein M569_03323 [Genlisea aurea]|uniref:non-specific serine/threonine protein kinase n=1 Tax=Genlisea aurea TaxID=192259 RepID=S8EFP3_9LAMI|nr:hypothetical protein M569_03323 [Genlisea aurea]